MNYSVIARRIADDHNRIAQMISNGVDLKTGDNVILLGDVLADMRDMVQELSKLLADEEQKTKPE